MPAPLTQVPTDRAAFLEAVRATGLLTPAQLTKARALAASGSAADAAGTLVAAGLLTRFQAERLLAGRADGFVLGQYVLLDQVGRGSMSRVYKAKHRTMNRPVAIKVLSSELTRTAADREAFQREIRAAGKLAHTNIVTAYDANELADRFYLVLEFVDGPNLDALVRTRGPLPAAEACEYVRQAAAGLQHAHEKGMVHRDVKPTNLLVARPTPSAGPAVKIADFGIPKAPAGTSAFAAPEARGAGPVDHRADLYSLGAVLYFLLTGHAPGAAPVPVGQLRPDVPPEVGAVVHRLLAPDPAARFASAAELLVHLDAACVPVAIPVDDVVSFELPAYPVRPGQDSGYLSGRAQSSDIHVAASPDESPWAQLTDEAVSAGDTVPLELIDTPESTPQPYTAKPRHGEPVPLWMTAGLLVGVVLLCLAGIGLVVKLAAK